MNSIKVGGVLYSLVKVVNVDTLLLDELVLGHEQDHPSRCSHQRDLSTFDKRHQDSLYVDVQDGHRTHNVLIYSECTPLLEVRRDEVRPRFLHLYDQPAKDRSSLAGWSLESM